MIKYTKSALALLVLTSFGLLGCSGAQKNEASQYKELAKVALADNNQAINIQPKVPDYIAPDVSEQSRAVVEKARDAVQKKRWQDLENLVPIAAQDPTLGMYPRYWLLRHKLQNRATPIPIEEVKGFLYDYPDTYLAELVRSHWILASTRMGDYANTLAIQVPVNPWNSVRCSLVLSNHMLKLDARSNDVKSQDALAAFAPNTDCWEMLDQLANDNVVSKTQLKKLLQDSLEENKLDKAKRIASILFSDADIVQYVALMKNPKNWLEKQKKPTSQAQIDLATVAMSRLARSKDRQQDAKYIQSNWQNKIPESDMQWVWSQFGLIAALNVENDAAKWYRLSGNHPMTDYNHAWEVRAELRALPINWARVMQSIERMSDRQASEPVWVYWYGRALAAQGQTEKANNYFSRIAGDLSFYGQLAAEELGGPQPLPAIPAMVTSEAIIQAQKNPSLQRAIELFKLGWRPEAVPEWNFALRGMDDMQLRGAAEFALSQNIYDRVVNTSLLTNQSVDINQRFIAPFEEQVNEKAELINLDTAWIYGLIRQESRFITDAKSRVGASGLMQLMPATAKWVAKKIGMQDYHPSKVNEFDTNTVLGTNYMNMVLQDLNGSQLLATAGYNAGPGRSKRWRSRLPGEVEGAIFAETIPFTETRLYVKNVMSNAVYYATIFSGKPHSIKERLGVVSPSHVTKTALP